MNNKPEIVTSVPQLYYEWLDYFDNVGLFTNGDVDTCFFSMVFNHSLMPYLQQLNRR